MAKRTNVEEKSKEIAMDIWTKIINGELKSGTLLPKGSELQIQYSASQKVIDAARKILLKAGIVEVIGSDDPSRKGTMIR